MRTTTPGAAILITICLLSAGCISPSEPNASFGNPNEIDDDGRTAATSGDSNTSISVFKERIEDGKDILFAVENLGDNPLVMAFKVENFTPQATAWSVRAEFFTKDGWDTQQKIEQDGPFGFGLGRADLALVRLQAAGHHLEAGPKLSGVFELLGFPPWDEIRHATKVPPGERFVLVLGFEHVAADLGIVVNSSNEPFFFEEVLRDPTLYQRKDSANPQDWEALADAHVFTMGASVVETDLSFNHTFRFFQAVAQSHAGVLDVSAGDRSCRTVFPLGQVVEGLDFEAQDARFRAIGAKGPWSVLSDLAFFATGWNLPIPGYAPGEPGVYCGSI